MKTRTQAGGASPRVVPPLQRIAAWLSDGSQSHDHRPNIAKSLRVERHLFTGARALRRQHPKVFDAVLAWPEHEQAEGLVSTFGNYCGNLRKNGTSRWDLASRLSPEAFVRLYLSSSKGLIPALCALPDPMLERAATMNGDLSAAFVWCGRNDYRAKASAFFPGIDPSLDPRIIERRLELNVDLLTELAACQQGDGQYGFFDRWVKDSPDVARAWVQTPSWKRPLLHRCTATFSLTNPAKNKPCVDPEAHQIWESFKYLRGQLMGTTDTPSVPHRRQTEHPQAVGTFFQHFAKFTFQDRPRWRDVFWNFGFMLAHGKDVGDMSLPPWGNR